MYKALAARVQQIISPEKRTIFLADRREYDYLPRLKEAFPSLEFFLEDPDLVVIGEDLPPIPSHFRYIQRLDPWAEDIMRQLDRLNRKAPVIIFNPYFEQVVIDKGFKLYQPINSPDDRYHEILFLYLSIDLASMVLSYLTRTEILVREWENPCEPTRIAIHPQGKVYVIGVSRIMVYNREGVLLHEWKGFQKPTAIAISPKGEIYVADVSRIKVFSPEREYLREFVQDARLLFPDDMAFSPYGESGQRGELYVLDRNVIIFDGKGTHLGTITPLENDKEREFGDMNRIAISPEGHIYISDHANSRIQILTTGRDKYRDALSHYLIPCLAEMTLEYIPFELSLVATIPLIEVMGVALSIREGSCHNIYASGMNFGDRYVFVFSPDRIYRSKLRGKFVSPSDIAVSPGGEIYVVDSGTRLIRVFDRRYD